MPAAGGEASEGAGDGGVGVEVHGLRVVLGREGDEGRLGDGGGVGGEFVADSEVFEIAHGGGGSGALREIFRENGVIFGRREQGFQGFQTLAEIAAGDLAGSGFDVDIAADAMEVERHGVAERLAGVFAEGLAVFAGGHGAAQKGLFEMPAAVVHFAVDFGAQFFAEQTVPGILHLCGPALGEQGSYFVEEKVMIVGNLLTFDGEEEGGEVVGQDAGGQNQFGFRGFLVHDGDGAFGVGALEEGREHDADFGQQGRDGGRKGGDGIGEVLAMVLFGYGIDGVPGKAGIDRSEGGAKTSGELFNCRSARRTPGTAVS